MWEKTGAAVADGMKQGIMMCEQLAVCSISLWAEHAVASSGVNWIHLHQHSLLGKWCGIIKHPGVSDPVSSHDLFF